MQFAALPCRGGNLVIDDEVIRRRRSPDVERILERMIGALPFDVGRNEVDVVRVFGEAAPRVLDVTEVVGSDHVPPDTPAAHIAAVRHVLHPQANLVDALDDPARVMQSRPARLLDTLYQVLEVLEINSEAQVLELLPARRGKDRSPAMRVAVRVQIEALALAARIEAEFRIEPLRIVEIRYGKNRTIERMDGGHAVATWLCLRRRLHR